jgi:hypothetical protein
MNKVYFDKNFYGCWVVKELDDIYSFRYINKKTNEEFYEILSWKKSIKNEDYGLDDNSRLYSLDFLGEEFLFYGKYSNDRFFINSIDKDKLETLFKEKDIEFIGSELVDGSN